MDEVFSELQKLSSYEQGCFGYMMERKKRSGSVCLVALSAEEMEPLYASCDDDTIVSTARVIADTLAEESGKLGLVAYYDNPARSDLVQFRLRRARRLEEVRPAGLPDAVLHCQRRGPRRGHRVPHPARGDPRLPRLCSSLVRHRGGDQRIRKDSPHASAEMLVNFR